MDTKENKMGTTPVFKLIIKMSLPAMFSMLVQALYNIVDSYFVAQISDNALTAISLAFPIQMLMVSVGVGTGIGLNSLISRRLGEKRQEEANSAATHGIILGIFSWAIFAILGLFFTRYFFSAFTDNVNTVNLGTTYFTIVSTMSFGIFVQINIEKTLQATGNMIYPMVFQLIGAITNIILDPIFIFEKGATLFGGAITMPFGFGFGMGGAAIATVIGQILALIVSLIVIFTKSHAVHITFKNFKLSKQIISDIYAVGLPSMVMQSIGSILVICLNAILITFSDAAVSVLGVYFKLQSFVFMPIFGLNHGVMPIIGYNYGAKNKVRLLQALRYGTYIAAAIMFSGMVVFWLIPDKLLMIFNASEEMLRIGTVALKAISTCFVPAAVGILFSTLFQAIGKGKYSLFVSLLRQLVIILPVALFMSQFGVNYVWLSFPIAEVVSLFVSIGLFASVYKKYIKQLQ